jgi:hypothetical protein
MFASPALAVPTMQVTNVGLDANGNWTWIVGVTPDTAFFVNNPPNGVGGSTAVTMGLISSGNFVSSTPAVATPNVAHLIPGGVIFGWEMLTDVDPGAGVNNRPVGIQANLGTREIYASLGTVYFTSGGSKPILTVTTRGPSTTTDLNSSLSLHDASIIAQNDPNSTNDTFNFAPGTANRSVRAGDSDLSGVIDFTDFQILQAAYNRSSTNWTKGDFDRSGTTVLADFQILDQNFNQSGGANNALNAIPTVTGVGAQSLTVPVPIVSPGLPAPTSAAVVTTKLTIRPDGTFRVTLEGTAGSENAGIASYQFTLGNVTSLSHVSPEAANATNAGLEVGPAGFTLYRSPSSVNNSPSNPITVTASQDTVNPTPHVIHGFGLEDSSFLEEGIIAVPPATQGDWNSPLLVATGTWSDVANALPSLSAASVVVFDSQGGTSAAISQSNLVTVFVPEPSACALIGLALLGVVGFAFRRTYAATASSA